MSELIHGKEKPGFVQTRAPQVTYDRLRWLAHSPAYPYRTMAGMNKVIFQTFLHHQPWNLGLKWRKPQKAGEDTGFVQVNIQLPQETAKKVRAQAAECGVSVASFAYTALYWWVAYIHSPSKK